MDIVVNKLKLNVVIKELNQIIFINVWIAMLFKIKFKIFQMEEKLMSCSMELQINLLNQF